MPAHTSDFAPSTHQGKVIITRESEKFRIEMSPAEADKATHIIGLALSMFSWDHVPEHITHTPFVIRFFKHRVLALERTDRGDTIPFRVNEGDDLIKAIRLAQGMCLNEQTHGRAVSARPSPGDTIVSDEPL